MQYDVIIIGGGASGLFCAYEASKKGLRVALMEQKKELGEKLRLAGGGMGNMTNRSLNFQNNMHTQNTPSTNYISYDTKQMHFLLSSLFQDFSCNDMIALLENFDITYEERDFGQIFCLKPVKHFINALKSACKKVDFFTNTLIKHVHYTREDENYLYHVRLEDSVIQNTPSTNNGAVKTSEIIAKKLVIATGSTAYPQIGASDFGLRLAKKWGHKVYDFFPVLVPLTLEAKNIQEQKNTKIDPRNNTQNKMRIENTVQKDKKITANTPIIPLDLSGLEGISLPVRMRVNYPESSENPQKQEFSDPCDVRSLLFTHKGISGPACLVSSCFLNPQKVKPIISIDFLPNTHLLELMHAPDNGKKILKNLLLPLLPDRLAYRLIPLELQNKKVAELSKKQRQVLVERIQNLCFYVTQNEGLKKAEAARGGISLKDLQNNMESKLFKGLYFCGEVIDITGLLGGYNIHFAFASAKRIAKNLY